MVLTKREKAYFAISSVCITYFIVGAIFIAALDIGIDWPKTQMTLFAIGGGIQFAVLGVILSEVSKIYLPILSAIVLIAMIAYAVVVDILYHKKN